jgi:trimethylamine--corrinoid protein Co-methyltransferase
MTPAAEKLHLIAAVLEPPATTDAAPAVEAIREVGPGSHFFHATHTLARYERAFYAPLLSDWRNFETWSEDGALDATQRANRIWKTLLADYQQPPMDPAVAEELAAFVAKRKEEGGAPS